MAKSKSFQRKKIHYRIRKKINGTGEVPRLSVFRSSKNIYCQLIDDLDGRTLVAASSKEITGDSRGIERAKAVGKLIAEKAKSENITKCVFDRSGYLYHGRIKGLADGARENGLNI